MTKGGGKGGGRLASVGEGGKKVEGQKRKGAKMSILGKRDWIIFEKVRRTWGKKSGQMQLSVKKRGGEGWGSFRGCYLSREGKVGGGEQRQMKFHREKARRRKPVCTKHGVLKRNNPEKEEEGRGRRLKFHGKNDEPEKKKTTNMGKTGTQLSKKTRPKGGGQVNGVILEGEKLCPGGRSAEMGGGGKVFDGLRKYHLRLRQGARKKYMEKKNTEEEERKRRGSTIPSCHHWGGGEKAFAS